MDAKATYKSVVKEIPSPMNQSELFVVAHCILMGCCVIAAALRNSLDETDVSK